MNSQVTNSYTDSVMHTVTICQNEVTYISSDDFLALLTNHCESAA
jgi:hypothetical protein